MRLMLIRHGDPDYANDALTELGHRQARLLADRLSDAAIDEIYVSPRGRARLTAEYTLRRRNQEGPVLDWLAELNGKYADNLWAWNMHGVEAFQSGGVFSVTNWHEEIVYGPHMKAVAQPLFGEFDRFMKEQGYERAGFRYRVRRSTGKTIAFFCHAGLSLTLLSHLLHIPLPAVYAQFSFDPSSVTTLALDEKDGYGVFRLVCLNDMSHCRGLAG
ncbi:MAG: histidine phosphatase family protein [Kiritimatiellae bacterium]|nr:histidine phosphatase family protein [Kiritimatiellia bacterium]